MDDDGRREVLGWVVADREDEASVRALLIDLRRRGLDRPRLFITDDSGGIVSAVRLEYPHTPRQSCTFHRVNGIERNLRDRRVRKEILREAADIYVESGSRREAVERFRMFCRRWRRREPEAVRLFGRGFEDSLRYFDFPPHLSACPHRQVCGHPCALPIPWSS